jgi:hypothetical protein
MLDDHVRQVGEAPAALTEVLPDVVDEVARYAD